jgi:hypothetical protein
VTHNIDALHQSVKKPKIMSIAETAELNHHFIEFFAYEVHIPKRSNQGIVQTANASIISHQDNRVQDANARNCVL